jgi:predicted nucleic acid-binding protein
LIYVDCSVLLAAVFREAIAPAASLWQEPLATSRLTHYEVWNRLHAYRADTGAHTVAGDLLNGIFVLELSAENLSRALEPFPVPVRTLDGLHLASAVALSQTGVEVAFATYDRRLAQAAAALDLEPYPLP